MRLLSQLAGCNTLSSSALQRAIILKRKHEKLISRSQPVSKCLKPERTWEMIEVFKDRAAPENQDVCNEPMKLEGSGGSAG
jgi:hypothetical protein